MITASLVRDIVRAANANFDRDQIEKNIEKVITDAAIVGRNDAEYFVTARDWLLAERPQTFKKMLNEAGYSVSFTYDEDFRAGMKELKSLRINWSKK